MWFYQGREFTEDMIDGHMAFVYIIVNKTNRKKYIGKKKFIFKRRKKTTKGRAKLTYIDSDWKDYYGSNAELLADVAALGKDSFFREIVRLCTSQAESSYYEAKLQFEHDVLLRQDFYNAWLSVKVTRKHLSRLQKP